MTRDRVDDDEEVYRRVPPSIAAGQMCYEVEQGRVVFKTAAFNDRSKCPSVDRATLRLFNAHRTRQREEDGIVALTADAIRRLGPIALNRSKKPVPVCAVDVSPDPIFFTNFAHAIIIARPAITGSAFNRLKDGLVRLANESGWRVEPRTTFPQRRLVALFEEAIAYLVHRVRGTR